MNKPTVRERFRYWFDQWMSRGPVALIALLGLATVVLVLVVFGLVSLFTLFGIYPNDDPTTNPADTLWGNLMRTLDPGTMGGDTGWLFRILMLIITVGGLIIVASLIGIISGAFDSKVEDLRKGRSRVLETDHTLILGWSSKIFPILSEIVIANESRKKASIVILADRDKVEMEDEIFAKLGATGTTKIICRTGDPMDLGDLEISNPHTARSIILLAPDGSSDPDSDVIKTALAITNNPRRREGSYHIVGEIEQASNLEAARLVGKDEAHWILGADLIGRITVQSCRQSGLSVVYSELLDFDGDEIYFTEQPTLHGMSYSDTQFAFATSSVMGIVKGGIVNLNPTPDTIYEFGDSLIVIAEDDSTIALAPAGSVDESALSAVHPEPPRPERTLVLGYNAGLPGMLRELDEYVAAGSTVTVLADVDTPLFGSFDNLVVTFTRGDASSRTALDALRVDGYDHIIVLAYRDALDAQRADSRTLITLLQLRAIEDSTDADLNIVSEMLDDRNRELAEVTNADDFIVSDKLISLLLSQVSENRLLMDVFGTLFSSAGSEVYLNPAENYITAGMSVDFYTVLEAARRRGQTAIGYRIGSQARNSAQAYGVHVNPLKTDRVTFGPGDRVIVLAAE
ncbi:voltage-gated potassium channel Kch [Salinibacterium sp. CAN_S4]|uniref:CASTOR/POLLUX-related putative ion channel n=1 Tax=Salinibacterium sp. CAN_S4 TaxID=2787727 RepID=UPI0018EFC6F7